MAFILGRRVTKELKDLADDPESEIELESRGDKVSTLTGRFKGPPGSPYEGGKFEVDITLPNDYPFKPPVMRMVTRIWHPNISSQTGAICLDTLKSRWSPVLTMKTALISIQSLLASPEPKDPQDAQVARQMMTDPKAFDLEARRWAVKYAGSPASLLGNQNGGSSANAQGDSGSLSVEADPNEGYGGYSRALVDRFVQMGFDRDRVVEAFDHFGLDRNEGNDYELEEERSEDITSRLLGDS